MLVPSDGGRHLHFWRRAFGLDELDRVLRFEPAPEGSIMFLAPGTPGFVVSLDCCIKKMQKRIHWNLF